MKNLEALFEAEFPCSGRQSQLRRGSSYILVLGTTMIVSTLGLGALLAVRAQARAGRMLTDVAEARQLAHSAIDLARLMMANDLNWRTTYAGGQWMVERQADVGKFYTWKVLDDATGGPVSNNEMESVRIVGKGRVGTAVQLWSTVLDVSIFPLDVLRTTVHSESMFDVRDPITTTGGPVSTNGILFRGDRITGAAEAAFYFGFGSITGGLTCPAPTKPLPDQAVFDAYRAMATQIPWATSGDWTITWPLLSSGINPSGGATNANGIYYISVPPSAKLTLEINRIRGTLLVECGDKASFRQWNPVCWESHSPDLPILLIKHATNRSVDDWIEAGSGSIMETVVGANLNPSHTPYGGVSDGTIDASDSYPSQMKGLIHIMAPSAGIEHTTTRIGNDVKIIGTVISDQEVEVRDGGTSNLIFDSNLYANPPKGYYTLKLTPRSGTWRQEILP